MDETLKQALEALKLARSEIWRLLDVKGVTAKQASEWHEIVIADAAIAAIEQYKPVVRMLTANEVIQCEHTNSRLYGVHAEAIQRKFAEVNGLTIGEHG